MVRPALTGVLAYRILAYGVLAYAVQAYGPKVLALKKAHEKKLEGAEIVNATMDVWSYKA